MCARYLVILFLTAVTPLSFSHYDTAVTVRNAGRADSCAPDAAAALRRPYICAHARPVAPTATTIIVQRYRVRIRVRIRVKVRVRVTVRVRVMVGVQGQGG